MAIKQITIPNYDETLAVFYGVINSINNNAPATVEDVWDGPCVDVKGSQDCGTFYLEDRSTYPNRTEPEDFVMNVSVVYRTKCGDTHTCAPPQFNPWYGRMTFDAEYGDGEYVVMVEMTVTSDEYGVFVNTYEYPIKMYCCQNKVETLKNELSDCMAAISCKIDGYKNIGRNFTKLTSRYLKMSNLLWVMNNNVIDCKSYDSLACLFKKI